MRTEPRSGWRTFMTPKDDLWRSCRRRSSEGGSRQGALFRTVWRGFVGQCAGHARLLWRGRRGAVLHRRGWLLEQVLERTKDGRVLVIGDLELPATEARIARLRFRLGLLGGGAYADGQERACAVLAACDVDLEPVEGAEQGVRRSRGGARLAHIIQGERAQGARDPVRSARTGQLAPLRERGHGEVGLLLALARGAEPRTLAGSFLDLTHALERHIDQRTVEPSLRVGIHGE